MPATAERSIGTVIHDIGGNVDRIVRAELRFVVAELRARIEALSDVSVLVASAVVAATLAAVFLLLGAMFALSRVMPLWLAAMVVAVLPGAIATVLFSRVRAQIAPRLAPEPPQVLPVPRPPK